MHLPVVYKNIKLVKSSAIVLLYKFRNITDCFIIILSILPDKLNIKQEVK